MGTGLVRGLHKAGNEGTEDGDVDRPHLGRGGVFIRPGFEECLEAESVMDAIQAGIWEAQSGELLAHGA